MKTKMRTKAAESGFYSAAAQAAGGRTAALTALDALIRDLEAVIADLDQRIEDLEALIAAQEAGRFRGRPPSALEATFAQSVCHGKLAHLKKLRLASAHNLGACRARLAELGV